ncbi:hypothetical protein CRENBAI_021096 [Crenichthys baileyi]|uniref:Uncharacterized protein n=1 Tax=Crenichthys baileyi TaxID=28760 RepID=A0AAV9S456_9TELE
MDMICAPPASELNISGRHSRRMPASTIASWPGRSGCSAVEQATDWMVAAQQSLSPPGQVAYLRRPAAEAHSAPGKRARLLEPMRLSTKVRTPMPLREVQRSRWEALPVQGPPIRTFAFSLGVHLALSPLQAQGLRILPYLDDWLIGAVTCNQAVQDTHLVLDHVVACAFG